MEYYKNTSFKCQDVPTTPFNLSFLFSLLWSSVLSNHTANNHYGRLELESPGYQTAASLQPLHENSRQEKIEVQILPQVSLRTINDLEYDKTCQGENIHKKHTFFLLNTFCEI